MATTGPGQVDPASVIGDYVGSDACVGCHAEKYAAWSVTGHAHMVSEVAKPADFPGDIGKAAPELKAELMKADYIVAGQRFIGKDPNTMELKYLNVQWNAAQGAYVAYKGGSSWEASCAGCHTVNFDKSTTKFAEAGIGCESCHGPGKEHILSKGNPSKITIDYSSETCGSCHNGGNMPDGTRWPLGFKPGMTIAETGFVVKPVDPAKGPPDPALHLRQYAALVASGHLNAVTSLEGSGHAGANCWKCHSAEALVNSTKGLPTDATHLKDGVSCVACHDPHSNQLHAQLRNDEGLLCAACHTASIAEGQTAKPGSTVHHPMKEMVAGYGAIGVAPTPSFHTDEDITCVSCHMTEGNHMFAVLMPSMTAGTTRVDTCTSCHKDSSPDGRQGYVEMWQSVTRTRVGVLRAGVTAAQAKVTAQPGLSDELKAKVNIAHTNLSLVEADASWGGHNFEYAMKILDNVDKNLKEFHAAVK